MGQNTKIDWCNSTWNPVTGCEHRCNYSQATFCWRAWDYKPTDEQMKEANWGEWPD